MWECSDHSVIVINGPQLVKLQGVNRMLAELTSVCIYTLSRSSAASKVHVMDPRLADTLLPSISLHSSAAHRSNPVGTVAVTGNTHGEAIVDK